MAPNSKSYIARSALASFILEVSQSYEPGIADLRIEFADTGLDGFNWTVVSIDPGTVDPLQASVVIATVVRVNSGWVMVEDGSELDGHVVELPGVLH